MTLEEAVRKTVAELRGSYAFLAVSDKEPGTLVGARLNCPMVVGLGEGEFFLASDLTAFLSHTRDVLFLEDGEMVIATPDGAPDHRLRGEAEGARRRSGSTGPP